MPNQAHAFFAPIATDPDKTGTTQPGESKGKAQTVNVADANCPLMVVAKLFLWRKSDNKMFHYLLCV